jgi:hypothetical protein
VLTITTPRAHSLPLTGGQAAVEGGGVGRGGVVVGRTYADAGHDPVRARQHPPVSQPEKLPQPVPDRRVRVSVGRGVLVS